jgi:hypothetical protein
MGIGHKCYGCGEYFRDSNPNVVSHKGCKSPNLGICVDRKEFGKYHYENLRELSKQELIVMVQEMAESLDGSIK